MLLVMSDDSPKRAISKGIFVVLTAQSSAKYFESKSETVKLAFKTNRCDIF